MAEPTPLTESGIIASHTPEEQEMTDELDVRWMDHQSTEREWYFVVMEPASRGIMRRGFGAYIGKASAYEQKAVQMAASRSEADYEAMVWAKKHVLEMAQNAFRKPDSPTPSSGDTPKHD